MRDEFGGFSIHIVEDKEGGYIAYFLELANVSAYGATAEEAVSEPCISN